MTIRRLSIARMILAVLSGCASSGGLNRKAVVSEAKLSQARAMVNSQRQYNQVVYQLSVGACAKGDREYRAPFSLRFNNKAIMDQELRSALYAELRAEDQGLTTAATARALEILRWQRRAAA